MTHKKKLQRNHKTASELPDTSRHRNWHRPGYTKDGVKLPDREMPKERLSPREFNLLTILRTHANTFDNAKPMRFILDKYTETFSDYLESSLCSAALLILKENWFASLISGKTAIVNKHTEERKTTKKPKYYLSDMVNFGFLTVDPMRWVVLNGQHIASVKTRLRVEENDRRKAAMKLGTSNEVA